jgi:hypothetical protein
MPVDIQMNISFPPPNVVSGTWTTGGGHAADQPERPADGPTPPPEVRVIPIGTSVLAPGLVTPFGV